MGSWVTMTMVWPISSTARRMKVSTSALARESRLPVGSSAKMISGRLASARATATRCCWPPDISLGRCCSRVADAHGVDDLVDPFLVAFAAREQQRQRDVLRRAYGRNEVVSLEDVADAVPPQD